MGLRRGFALLRAGPRETVRSRSLSRRAPVRSPSGIIRPKTHSLNAISKPRKKSAYHSIRISTAHFSKGCGRLQATLANRARCSAADAYLHPCRDRKNLKVLTHAYVTKILFDGKRAIGVDYLHFGALKQAHAACEVIISAGALRSPQLLMLSEIGPEKELEREGVDVRLNLPGVGKNLQDHLNVRVRCEINQPLTFAALPDEVKAAALREYEADRSGPSARIFSRRAHSSKAARRDHSRIAIVLFNDARPRLSRSRTAKATWPDFHLIRQPAVKPRRNHARLVAILSIGRSSTSII